MNKIYLKASVAAFIAYLVLLIICPEWQICLFYDRCGDFGADYFNVCRYVADADPYGNTLNGPTEHSGLPLGYLWKYIFAQTADYSSMSLHDCWHNVWGCIIPFLFVSLFRIGFLGFALMEYAKKYTSIKPIYLTPIFLSSIFLFSVERGNSILLTVSLIILFLVYYDSPSPAKRWLAMLFLSISGIFKVVPGLLCLLYLKDRRFKEFFLLVGITLVLIFLPFLCFKGGFDNILLVPERMFMQVSVYGAKFTCYRFGFLSLANLLGVLSGWSGWLVVGRIMPYLMLLASVTMFFLSRDRNKSVLYLLFVLALFAGSASPYNDLYLFPLFIYTLASGDSRSKAFILLLFFFIMQPIQIVFADQSLSWILANICSLTLWIYILASDAVNLYRVRRITK